LADYLELDFELAGRHESETDLAAALLAESGFEGFLQEEGRILAYIRSGTCEPASLASFLRNGEMKSLIRSVRESLIPERNWNELREKTYAPVEISGKCLVRAPFHAPDDGLLCDLVISPKMSFGTAHHEKTRLMIDATLEYDLSGTKVLDFGCGTGVLAILAEKVGASEVLALDRDSRAHRNALEPLVLNRCRKTGFCWGKLQPGPLDGCSLPKS
jgi:ribosomal protein L11 methyltransferase